MATENKQDADDVDRETRIQRIRRQGDLVEHGRDRLSGRRSTRHNFVIIVRHTRPASRQPAGGRSRASEEGA
jgi:hypothetical protein